MAHVSRWTGWLVLVALLALFPAQAEARWLRAELEKFVVYSDGPERDLLTQTAKLEDFDLLLRLFHKPPADEGASPRLEIYLIQNPRDLKRAYPQATNDLAGYYLAGNDITYALGLRGQGGQFGDHILFHEYTHHFMLAHFPYPYPAWLVEGWAEFFATTRIFPDAIEVGRDDGMRNTNNTWMPLEKLLVSPVSELTEPQRQMFYSQVGLLTHYMLSDDARAKQLTVYMQAVAAGEHPARAFEKVLGRPLAAIDRDLQAYAKAPKTYLRFKREKQAGAAIKVTTLSKAADDLLLENLRAQNSDDEDDQNRAFLADLRARAARHAGDPLAELILARAEVAQGDRKAGEAILERLLSANPTDPQVLSLLGMSRLKAAAEDSTNRARLMREARSFLVRSIERDANHYPTLFAYAMSRNGEPGFPDDNTLDLLIRVRNLAPQVKNFDFMAVEALAYHRRYDEAEFLLRRMTNDPHSGEASKAAADRLVKLQSERRERPPPSPPTRPSPPG